MAISNTDLRLDKAEGFDEMWKVGTEEPKRQQLRSRVAGVDYVMLREDLIGHYSVPLFQPHEVIDSSLMQWSFPHTLLTRDIRQPAPPFPAQMR